MLQPANSLTEQVADNPHEESYFYSAAIINGFYIIMPCQRSERGRRRIIGLLQQFPGGRQSSVGTDPSGLLRKSSPQSFWLGFSKDDHRPFMSILELSEPKLNDGLSTFEVQPFWHVGMVVFPEAMPSVLHGNLKSTN